MGSPVSGMVHVPSLADTHTPKKSMTNDQVSTGWQMSHDWGILVDGWDPLPDRRQGGQAHSLSVNVQVNTYWQTSHNWGM